MSGTGPSAPAPTRKKMSLPTTANGPGFSETFNAFREIFSFHAGSQFGSTIVRPKSVEWYDCGDSDSVNCSLTIYFHCFVKGYEFMPDDYYYTIRLSRVVPSSVRVRLPTTDELRQSTADSSSTSGVEVWGLSFDCVAECVHRGEGKDAVWILVGDRATADRLANALNHMVELRPHDKPLPF